MKTRHDALSRREFLRLCGVTAAALSLPGVRTPAPARFYGRAFAQAAVRTAPHGGAAAARTLAPDAVIPVKEARGGWFKTTDGYVDAHDVQPVPPYTRPEVLVQMPSAPFWAEVIAPAAALRRWPLTEAEIAGRVGYGAVFEIGDIQTDDRGTVWYRAREPGAWLQALHLCRLRLPEAETGQPTSLHIDCARCLLEAHEAGEVVLSAPVSPAVALRPPQEESVVSAKRPSMALGVPWVVAFGAGWRLHGAYWHNLFGTPHGEEAQCIAMAPAVARWVYEWVSVNQTRVVVYG